MKFLFPLGVLVLLLSAACSTAPTPTLPPPTQAVIPTTDAGATETAITQRVLATLTASAPTILPTVPTVADTVTPPPLPTQAIADTPTTVALATVTAAPGTVSTDLSPSVTPIPVLPTKRPIAAPTQPPSPPPPPQVSEQALRGKIMFRSSRNGGSYPDNFQFFAMNPDGSDVQQLERYAAEALYKELKPLEGFSPDRTLLVLGESTCYVPQTCHLYIGAPEVVVNRSQGQWLTSKNGERADKPVWSPDGSWITFLWNRGTDKTKNIYKGLWAEQNQNFKRLTNFRAGRDTQDPTYSPDGSMLAFSTQDGPVWQVWVLDATADECVKQGDDEVCPSNPHNISHSTENDWDPLWIK